MGVCSLLSPVKTDDKVSLCPINLTGLDVDNFMQLVFLLLADKDYYQEMCQNVPPQRNDITNPFCPVVSNL